MRFFEQFFQNRTLICVMVAWLVAQTIKFLIQGKREGKWQIATFFRSGGMPSSHSASTAALTMMVGYTEGFDKPIFAVCFLFMFVVMYDAAGVRLETGRQGKALNTLADFFSLKNEFWPPKGLKEQVGHSPTQVVVGALLGILCALAFINL